MIAISEKLSCLLDLTGLLVIELFVTENEEILINEFACRPHNSGHRTIEGCERSQFENHVRTSCGWKLSPVKTTCREAVMVNLLGLEADDKWMDYIDDPAASSDIYGKRFRHDQPNRKLGHGTTVRR